MYMIVRGTDFVSFYDFILLDFGTVPTVCYFWNCANSVLFLELFQQCAIFVVIFYHIIDICYCHKLPKTSVIIV
jgi:hypothetical protein